jgi:hypothetical protein
LTSKGDRYECDACGVVCVVDEICGCAECDLICCGQPMKKTGKKPVKKKTQKKKTAKKKK